MIDKESNKGEYYAFGMTKEEFYTAQARCKALCYEHNMLHPAKKEERNKIIRELFGKTGENFLIEQPIYCDFGFNIEIGENFYVNHNTVFLDCAKISFGDNVFIAPNCGFYAAGHPINVTQRNAKIEYAHPITIGNNVWIGGGVTVLPGVTIGDNCTIGAGSVVNKDIPANSLAAGNPCRVIRDIADEV